ncbi:hypothetical protein Pa4123_74900 [Phytohabitans aurantiacus]|uniref:DUF4262 domain-containing protein n=2 Tax=Phytohabitans aurantiacus TaxID=3016789 RepID=A0ABQ5R7S1_9ACTN|nr:hypothetical protein Pa4123_74900 [Phytohabitans aurantiacus]
MVTGLALKANDPAVAVLLLAADGGYRPFTLGLYGIYNCYGTIDSVVEDTNSGLVWTYLVDRLRDGRLVVGAGEQLDPTDDIDILLEVVERNQLAFLDEFGSEPALTLDGAVVHHALIYQPVWEAVAAHHPAPMADGWGADVYGERLPDLAAQVVRLGAIDAFLAARGLTWAPPGESRQRYPTDLGMIYDLDEARSFVDQARRDLADVPLLAAAIDHSASRLAERDEHSDPG